MNSRIALTCAGLICLASARVFGAGFSAETGSFVFQRYAPEQYGASPQNWAAVEDPRGVMFFGNDDGVLEFDGVNWRPIPMNLAQSLAVDAKGTVYVGGKGEFGLLAPDSKGNPGFVSLLDRVPQADRSFANVWRTIVAPDGVYFSAYARLFRLNADGSVHVWKPVSNFGKAFYAAGAVYVKTREQGLLRVHGNALEPVPGGDIFAKLSVAAGTSWPRKPDEGLIGTVGKIYRISRDGIAPFPTQADSWLETNFLNSIAVLPGGEIAVGTRRGGMALISPDGALDRIVSKSEGLPDDWVEAIVPDDQGGVWIAQNNGISRFNPGLTQFGPADGLEGDAQYVDRPQHRLIAGTTTGLYELKAAPGNVPRFERVAGMTSRVWAMISREDLVLAATDNGVFDVTGGKAVKVFVPGQVIYDLSFSHDPDVVYAAGRSHVFLLRRDGAGWRPEASFDQPSQEFHTVLEDSDGKVWAVAEGRIVRLDFNAHPVRAEQFGAAQGVPAGWVNARRLNGRITFATTQGLRRFVPMVGRFGPDLALGDRYANGTVDVANLFETGNGDVWVTGKKYHDLLRRKAAEHQPDGYDRMPMPLEGAGIGSIFWMRPDPDGVVWAVGPNWKLYRWDPALAGNPDRNFRPLTRQILSRTGRDTIWGGDGRFGSAELPWRSNALRFVYAAPFYERPGAVEYQSRLEGSDPEWSSWSRETQRDYTRLAEGNYTFHVRARSPHGTVREESVVSFGVLPPWYRTWWAYLLWLACAGLAVWSLVKWRTRQLVLEKHRLEGIVEERTIEVREEQRKTQSLLLNILPERVAEELKTTGVVQPMAFDDVTVCFTDFVGFTLSSEKMPPATLVGALNEYFTRFDEIVTRYGLEKLKTIGDSYMFVSGLPARRASHAVDAVLAALEMAAVVRDLRGRAGGTGWNLRVGLNSGPVVAGVVGIRKFAFDIWGDTVNFAARMESSGVPGRVNLSQRTWELTRGLIEGEARGYIRIKEGRELPMHLAIGPAANFVTGYESRFGYPAPVASEGIEATLHAELVTASTGT